jgi:cysteinyl-tRNA synthetase
LRLFVISRHYRSPVDFSDGAIIEISRGLERAYRTLKKAEKALGEMEIQKASSTKCPVLDAFREAMDDDLNTARALGHVFEAVRELNKIMDGGQPQDMDLDQINAWVAAIRDMGGILGILTHDPDQFLEYGQSKGQAVSGLSREEIEELIAVRTRARKAKDWDKADSIRNQLKDNGVLLEDVGAETRWRFET